MAQTKDGAVKSAAKRIGVSAEEYLAHVAAGLKWCFGCKGWRQKAEFNVDRSRFDGLTAKCGPCRRVEVRVNTKGRASSFKGQQHSTEAREKMSAARAGNTNRVGKVHTAAAKARVSKSKRASGNTRRGKTHPRWKGGITPLNHKIRTSVEYADWRNAVYSRDGYVCQKCGDGRGGNLHAHHIKPFADYPQLRFKVGNGLTVCEPCHEKIHFKPDSIRNQRKARSAQP